MNTLPTINYDDSKVVSTLKATVAQGATDPEFAMFIEFCRGTGLNPFKREVWFVKTKGYTKRDGTTVEPKVQIMTGINGYLQIANRHPQFDGMETTVEREEKSGKPIKAVCKVYRKDRRMPHTAEAFFSEYYRPGYNGKPSIWDEKPTIMISKVAKSIALREAFPQELNGLYTEEEMPPDYSLEHKAAVIPIEPPKPEVKEFGNGEDLEIGYGSTCVFYALDGVNPARLDAAKKHLQEAGARYHANGDYYSSPVVISQLKNRQITTEQATERMEAAAGKDPAAA